MIKRKKILILNFKIPINYKSRIYLECDIGKEMS